MLFFNLCERMKWRKKMFSQSQDLLSLHHEVSESEHTLNNIFQMLTEKIGMFWIFFFFFRYFHFLLVSSQHRPLGGKGTGAGSGKGGTCLAAAKPSRAALHHRWIFKISFWPQWLKSPLLQGWDMEDKQTSRQIQMQSKKEKEIS